MPRVVARCIIIVHGTLREGEGGGGGGGWFTKLYVCALFIIDGLGHARWSLMMLVS